MVDKAPATASLSEVVRAIEITMSELGFQLMRLNSHVTPKTSTEEEYLPKLREGYRTAQYWLGILLQYQKGRLERLQQESTLENTSSSDEESVA